MVTLYHRTTEDGRAKKLYLMVSVTAKIIMGQKPDSLACGSPTARSMLTKAPAAMHCSALNSR